MKSLMQGVVSSFLVFCWPPSHWPRAVPGRVMGRVKGRVRDAVLGEVRADRVSVAVREAPCSSMMIDMTKTTRSFSFC